MAPHENPVLAMMAKADALAKNFDQVHSGTLAPLQLLVSTLLSPSNANGDPSDEVEKQLSYLRQALERMEQCVGEMMSMIYNVDLDLDRPTGQMATGKDPKAAFEHISELFHMYQAELLAKREALSDLTCEEISAEEFSQRWSSMEQIQEGRKQTMDDLADLLSALG